MRKRGHVVATVLGDVEPSRRAASGESFSLFSQRWDHLTAVESTLAEIDEQWRS